MGAPQDELTGLAAEITGHLHRTVDELAQIRADVQVLLEAVEHQGRRPSRDDLGGIREALQACLRREDSPMDGIGMAAAVGYLIDSDYWLEWWRHDGRGGLEFVAHNLNPHRDSFYDYSARSRFSTPASSGSPTITGPYIDLGGTNSYTVTVSVPVFTSSGFAGIAGADIAAGRFERRLLQAVGSRTAVVLTNAALRVIASNTARYLPGDLLRGHSMDRWTRVELGGELFSPQMAWQLFSPAP
ncbi:cache domain-containing protein [Kocuria sp. U4B]